MGDRPGFGQAAQANSFDFSQWQSFDRTQPARPTDNTRPTVPTDRTRTGTLELNYGDPQFDQKLWSGNYDKLKIDGMPQGVQISSWVDNKGFFMWYKGGNDNRQPHYLPAGLKSIEVNGFVQNVDEMKIQASLSAAKEADRAQQGFTSMNERTNPLDFAKRMGGMGWEQLQMQEKALRQAAQDSPNNPYFRLYLSDILVAEAFKPIMDQVNGNTNRVELNSQFTQQKLNEAIREAQTAEQIAQRVGGARYANTQLMPPLSPFGLNPYYYNPDMYWAGALYQGYRREAQIKMLQGYIQTFSSVELPPNLPGK